MDFIQTALKETDKFGSGKHGFKAGNPATGVQPTSLSAAWCDNVQQELVNAIEGAGLTINPAAQNQLLLAIQALTALSGVPSGAVQYFARAAAPTGWLKANGAAVSRTTYAALFTAIGTTFGAGDGATTFNVPDLRGEFLRGLDDGRGVDTARSLGSAQADDLKSHSHDQKQGAANQIGGTAYASANYAANAASGVTSPTTASGGTETRPRNIALLACIKI